MLFLIPARAGSKRLPGKNTKFFCGMPLYQWSVATADRVAFREDEIIVSTDNIDILSKEHWNCNVEKRPGYLCQDNSKTEDLIEYYFSKGYEDICLLQPTSPLRSDTLVKWLIARGDTCRTVSDGEPTGDCYIYRKECMRMHDVDIDYHSTIDIDTLEDFIEAEEIMRRRFK